MQALCPHRHHRLLQRQRREASATFSLPAGIRMLKARAAPRLATFRLLVLQIFKVQAAYLATFSLLVLQIFKVQAPCLETYRLLVLQILKAWPVCLATAYRCLPDHGQYRTN